LVAVRDGLVDELFARDGLVVVEGEVAACLPEEALPVG
jgi:hypothetical protein